MREAMRWRMVRLYKEVGEWTHRRASRLAGEMVRPFGVQEIPAYGQALFQSRNGQILVIIPKGESEGFTVQVTEYGERPRRAVLSIDDATRLSVVLADPAWWKPWDGPK